MLTKYILNSDIQKSLEHICYLLHINDEKIEELETSFIEVCNYIGLNMELQHAKRWFDIVNSTYQTIIANEIKIDDTLVLCSKMCSLCKLINENSIINIKSLRSQVINDLEYNLSPPYISVFENILPLRTSDSYNVSCKIAMAFVNYFEKTKDIDIESKEFTVLANKIRLVIEYITRKNIYIENNNSKDSDCIWFIWNIILKLTQSHSFSTIYKLFSYNWKSTARKKRLGILWGTVYLLKHKNIEWSEQDIHNFEKIKLLSKNLMIETKNRYPKNITPKKDINNDIKNIWNTYIPSTKT
jgi:hypothetical protein